MSDNVQFLPAAPEQLVHCLRQNEPLWESLQRLASLDLPNWYLGAGCIAQTVWNAAHAKPAAANIVDYDIVYFDPDLSSDAEDDVIERVGTLLADLPLRPDVKNQARVHLWYEARFGYKVRPYTSCDDALESWPTTATAVGLRLVEGTLRMHAPFGTQDLFSLIVRPNRVQITPAIYKAKVTRWVSLWPQLKIMPWEQGTGMSGSRWIV